MSAKTNENKDLKTFFERISNQTQSKSRHISTYLKKNPTSKAH